MSVYRQLFPLDSRADEYPTVLEMRLSRREAVCLSFSRTGLYLAAGCADGYLVLWDFLARTVALEGKIVPQGGIDCVGWDADGETVYACSHSTPGIFVLNLRTKTSWHVATPTAVSSFECSPSVPKLVLLVLDDGSTAWLDAEGHRTHGIKLDDAQSSSSSPSGVESAEPNAEFITCAALPSSAPWLMVGTSRGTVRCVTPTSRTCTKAQDFWGAELSSIGEISLPKRKQVHSIRIAQHKRFILVNHAAYSLYTINVRFSEEPQKQCDLHIRGHIQDVVNRRKFSDCNLSWDDEYVIASADNSLTLSIWNSVDGQPVKGDLAFAGRAASCVLWHPQQCFVVASEEISGAIFVWKRLTRNRWEAFAPNFVPITEHQNSTQYMEREDEWDLNPRDYSDEKLVMSGPRTKGDLAVKVDPHTLQDGADEMQAPLFLSPIIVRRALPPDAPRSSSDRPANVVVKPKASVPQDRHKSEIDREDNSKINEKVSPPKRKPLVQKSRRKVARKGKRQAPSKKPRTRRKTEASPRRQRGTRKVKQ